MSNDNNCGKSKLEDNPNSNGNILNNTNENSIIDKEGNYIIPSDYNPTDEKCFESEGGIIVNYYCYEGNIYGYEAVTDLVIPYKIDDMWIYEIAEDAFCYKNLTSIVLPNSVKTIKEGAFAGNKLEKVTLSEKIERIEDDSFQGDYEKDQYLIDKWIVPDSLTYIDSSCLTIKELEVDMKIIPEDAFIGSNIQKLTLGNNVAVIGEFAFSSNSLNELILPDSVTTIGKWAFLDSFIKKLVIPDSVTTIGEWAFYQNNLAEIHLGKNVEMIGTGAFEIGYGVNYNKYANNVDSNSDLKTIYLGNKNQRNFDWNNIIDGNSDTSYYEQIKYVLP